MDNGNEQTHSESAPHTKVAFVTNSCANAVPSGYLDGTEILIDQGLERMGDRSELIDIQESIGVVWVLDILGDTTQSSIVINAACPHLMVG